MQRRDEQELAVKWDLLHISLSQTFVLVTPSSQKQNVCNDTGQKWCIVTQQTSQFVLWVQAEDALLLLLHIGSPFLYTTTCLLLLRHICRHSQVRQTFVTESWWLGCESLYKTATAQTCWLLLSLKSTRKHLHTAQSAPVKRRGILVFLRFLVGMKGSQLVLSRTKTESKSTQMHNKHPHRKTKARGMHN